MKWLIKTITLIKKHKEKVAVSAVLVVLLLGFIGNILADKNEPYIKSLFKAFSILALSTPDKINIFNGLAYVLAVSLLYAGFFLLLFNNLINKWLFKLFLKEKNIVLFGFGEINKTFLENYDNSKRAEKIIVVDKEEKDFNEFQEKGYLFVKSEIDENLLKKFDFEKTTNIIVALGNDRTNIDIGLKLIDRLKNVKTRTKLIIHINDKDLSDLFFDKLKQIKQKKKELKIDLKVFSLTTEIVDNIFEKYPTKLVPYDYAKLNGNKKELKVAVIGNSDISIEMIKRIFINFIFPNDLKTKIYLIDKNEKEFLKKTEFETNYTPEKFPHITLSPLQLTYDLLQERSFWTQKDLIDVIIAFEDEDKNLETAIDLYEKTFVHIDKNKLKYPNIFFGMYAEFSLSKYIDKNNNFKNFYTFGNLKEVLSAENLLDDEKFEVAMQIHNSWSKEKDIKKAWYTTTYSNRQSSIAQCEHIPFKLLSLGFKTGSKGEDCRKEYEKTIKNIEKENISFEEFLHSGDYYKLCDTEHRRWMAYHFINNWEYDDYEGKELHDYKKTLKLHNCLIDFKSFKYDSIKKTFIYDFEAYKNIPQYLTNKKILKLEEENEQNN